MEPFSAETKITRQYLYSLLAANFNLIEKYLLLKHNRDFIIEIFEDSSRISEIIEREIDTSIDYSFESFNRFWKNIVETTKNESFRDYIDSFIRHKLYEKANNRSTDSFNVIAISLFKEIAAYQNKVISQNFVKKWFDSERSTNKNDVPQTFLSYAYVDKGISLALFIYFLIHGGFLYVNWMWSGSGPSKITKSELNEELSNSQQFLFLRTLNSELDYYGSSHIRQWCSWEIGNYYTKNKDRKYYLNFYGKTTKNDMLSTFNIFFYVKNGIING